MEYYSYLYTITKNKYFMSKILEVQKLVNKGKTTKEIAEILKISVGSVSSYKSHITMGNNPHGKKTKTTKKSNSYSPMGQKKMKSRDCHTNAIKKSKQLSGKILSLCGNSLRIEKKLDRDVSKDFTYDLVEHNETTFKEILSAVSKTKLNVDSVHKGKMSEQIYNAYPNKYAHLILDYCGLLETHKTEIDVAIDRNIVKTKGIIAMTFATRGTKPVMDVEPVENEAISFTAAKKYFSSFQNYKLVEAFKYHDSSDMMVIIIQRTK